MFSLLASVVIDTFSPLLVFLIHSYTNWHPAYAAVWSPTNGEKPPFTMSQRGFRKWILSFRINLLRNPDVCRLLLFTT